MNLLSARQPVSLDLCHRSLAQPWFVTQTFGHQMFCAKGAPSNCNIMQLRPTASSRHRPRSSPFSLTVPEAGKLRRKANQCLAFLSPCPSSFACLSPIEHRDLWRHSDFRHLSGVLVLMSWPSFHGLNTSKVPANTSPVLGQYLLPRICLVST